VIGNRKNTAKEESIEFNSVNANELRRLRYRLKRQGMLELDAWLSSLDDVLLAGDENVIIAINALLACEVPELLGMMHGDVPVPKILKVYLQKS